LGISGVNALWLSTISADGWPDLVIARGQSAEQIKLAKKFAGVNLNESCANSKGAVYAPQQ